MIWQEFSRLPYLHWYSLKMANFCCAYIVPFLINKLYSGFSCIHVHMYIKLWLWFRVEVERPIHLSVSYVSKQFWESLVTFTNELMLKQIVSQPTRGPNILDLCFMLHPDHSQGCTVIPGLIKWSWCSNSIISHQTLLTEPNKKADWNAIRQSIASLSEEYFYLNETQSRNVIDNWQYIHSHILPVIEDFIPTKLLST